jgi:ribosomal protein S6--L-glutamate ligase
VPVALDKAYRVAAVAAVKVMGLEVAGVDMLEGKTGPKILEINSSPGLEGIERASGVDVAMAIILHAEKYLEHRSRRRAKRRDAVIEDERRPRRMKSGGKRAEAVAASQEPPPPGSSRPRLSRVPGVARARGRDDDVREG